MKHYEKHSILTELNHGFRSGFSCETQLLNTIKDLYTHFDKNTQVDIAFLDFSKAFDVVPHSKLMRKLEHYGVTGKVNKWISKFLQHRKQSVVVEGSISSPVDVDSGVPQGTCLGPILFLTFINDISYGVQSSVRLFADDCLLYRPIRNMEDHLVLQRDLILMHYWAQTWGMKFNPSKCYIVSISKQDPKFHLFYKLCGVVLEHHKDNPYLGALISHDLSFSNHINTITAKANSMLGFLRRNLKYCPESLKNTAYISLVRSKLEYACCIWDPYLKKDVDKIEKTQRKGARFVKREYGQQVSVEGLLRDLKWEPLQSRRKHTRIIMFYKIINGVVRGVEHDDILQLNTNRTRSGTSGLDFQHIRTKLTQTSNSYYPRTVRDWNSVPHNIRASPTLDTFKGALPPGVLLTEPRSHTRCVISIWILHRRHSDSD